MGRAVFLIVAFSASAVCAAELTVFTSTGRRLRGELDRQTDGQSLWLRTTAPGISLRSRTDWANVTAVIADGKELTPDETIRLAQIEVPPLPAEPVPQLEPRSEVEWPDAPPVVEAVPPAPCLDCIRPRRVFVPRVETIDTRVVVANWDADAEPDGIEVEVRPTVYGRPIDPPRGAVSVRLYGEPIQEGSRVRILRRHDWPTELGRWSVPLHECDFVHGTAIVRLPFQQIDPFHGRRFAPVGYAHVRLGVNGQGAFDAGTPVVLRDPWRDDAFTPYALDRAAIQASGGR